METDRRAFLKIIGIAGASAAAGVSVEKYFEWDKNAAIKRKDEIVMEIQRKYPHREGGLEQYKEYLAEVNEQVTPLEERINGDAIAKNTVRGAALGIVVGITLGKGSRIIEDIYEAKLRILRTKHRPRAEASSSSPKKTEANQH